MSCHQGTESLTKFSVEAKLISPFMNAWLHDDRANFSSQIKERHQALFYASVAIR